MRALFIVAAPAGGVAVMLTPNDWGIHGYPPDGGSDKYTTLAAWDGTGAHSDMDEVFARYDADGFVGAAAPIPRPPSAFLLHGPLALLPDRAIIPVVGLFSVVAIVTTCWAAACISGLPGWWLGLLAVAIASGSNYWYANLGFLIPAMLSLAWLSLNKGRPVTSGVLFGVAAAVKAWPLIVVAALLIRRPTRNVALVARDSSHSHHGRSPSPWSDPEWDSDRPYRWRAGVRRL